MFADISFGDAWLPQFATDKSGTSIVVARSKTGNELLQDAISKNTPTLSFTGADSVYKSQQFVSMKQKLAARIALSRLMHRAIPNYNVTKHVPFKEFIGALFFYFENWLASRRYRLKLLQGYIVLRNQVGKVLRYFQLKWRLPDGLTDKVYIK